MAANELDVSDVLEIQRLLNSFNVFFDAGDADGFADLFVLDGVLESGSGDCATREERRGKVLGSLTRPPHRHFTTNILIEPVPGDPTRARSSACFIYMELRDQTIETRSIGTYTDELVKQDGRWRFAHRVARSDEFVA